MRGTHTACPEGVGCDHLGPLLSMSAFCWAGPHSHHPRKGAGRPWSPLVVPPTFLSSVPVLPWSQPPSCGGGRGDSMGGDRSGLTCHWSSFLAILTLTRNSWVTYGDFLPSTSFIVSWFRMYMPWTWSYLLVTLLSSTAEPLLPQTDTHFHKLYAPLHLLRVTYLGWDTPTFPVTLPACQPGLMPDFVSFFSLPPPPPFPPPLLLVHFPSPSSFSPLLLSFQLFEACLALSCLTCLPVALYFLESHFSREPVLFLPSPRLLSKDPLLCHHTPLSFFHSVASITFCVKHTIMK